MEENNLLVYLPIDLYLKRLDRLLNQNSFIRNICTHFDLFYDKKTSFVSLLKLNGLYKVSGARNTKKIFVHQYIYEMIYQRKVLDKKVFSLLRFEDDFFEMLIKSINGFGNVIRQSRCLDYRLDGYIPEYNIVIEYDESQHRYGCVKNNDILRQHKITEHLKCSFVRVDIGYEIEGLNQILKLMFNKK